MVTGVQTCALPICQIPGVGEQKLKDFADGFLGEIKNYLATNSPRTFSGRPAPQRPKRRSRLNDSQRETLRRFRNGESVDDISLARGFVRSTIFGHLAAAIESGESLELDRFFTAAQREEIASAFRKVSEGKLADVRSLLDAKFDDGELRIFRALAAC